jgi:putative ABC transport system permease protein
MSAVPLARRNVFQDRRRAGLSVGGLAVALVLVLVLEAVFAGAMRQVTAYLRTVPADVIVSQRGVRTMHMSSSALDPTRVDDIAAVPGVAAATPIRFTTATVSAGTQRQLSYVIGYDVALAVGGPHDLVEGRAPRTGEVVLDSVGADELRVRVGDAVELLGRAFRVSGLARGGTSITNTTSFIPTDDFAAVRGPAVSYVLIRAAPGVRASELTARIESAVPGTTAQTRAGMVRQEGRIVRDMSADLMQLMTIVALLIALAVIALTLFTATLGKLREYAVIKAIGGRPGRLVRAVLGEALWYVGMASVLAVLLTYGIGVVVAAVSPTVRLYVEPGSIGRLVALTIVVGGVGALVPLPRLLRLDPATAFRRAA